MNDKKLRILIEILTKEVGPEKAADILKKVTETSADATVATDKLTDATGKLNVKKTDLKGIVRALSREFPTLGIMGRLALNPLVGAAVAAVAIIGTLRREYAELQALLSRTADLTGLKGAFSGVETALVKSRSEAAALFADLSKSSGSIKSNADEAIAALDRQAQKTRELMEAEKERALAKLKFQLETGEITPDQFKSGVGGIESAFAASGRAAQDKLEADQLAAMQNAFTKADFERRLAARKAPGAIEAANLAEAEAARIAGNIPTGRANLRSQGDFISELIGKRDHAGRGFLDSERDRLAGYTSIEAAKSGEGGILAGDARAFVELNLRIQEERQKQSRMAAEQRALESSAEPAAVEAARLRREADALTNDLKRLDSDADALLEKIEKAKRDLPQDKAHRDRIGAIQGQTRIFNSGDAGQGAGASLLVDAATGAGALAAGARALPPQQAKAIAEATRIFGLQGQSNVTIISILSRLNDKQDNFQRALEQMQRKIATVPNPNGT